MSDFYKFKIIGSSISYIYEREHGRWELEDKDWDEVWSYNPVNGIVTKVETERGYTKTYTYVPYVVSGIPQTDGVDPIYIKAQTSASYAGYTYPTTSSVGSVYSTPLTSKMYDFVLAVDASGNSIVTSVREYTHGIWRNELIELGETYSVVSVNDAATNIVTQKIVKTEIEGGYTETSTYVKDANTGFYVRESQTYQVGNLVTSISLASRSGDDFLYGGDDRDDSISGGDGDDHVESGLGHDHLYGGGGNDYLYSGAGDDYVEGGDGDDLIIGGDGAGDDVYKGGLGTDTVKYTSATHSIHVNLGLGTASGSDINNDSLHEVENIIAGSGDDSITGSSSANSIYGGYGRDVLYGGIGLDTLRGEQGNDSLYGEGDDDYLYGGDGNDSLHGNDGDDSLWGDIGSDNLTGGVGDDSMHGGTGNDSLNGGLGSDALYGDAGNDMVLGGDGDDSLYGGTGNDLLYGGAGNDMFYIDDVTDRAFEKLDEGIDTVHILYSIRNSNYVLGSNLENGNLNNTGNFNLTGNALNNQLLGNSAVNILNGGSGDDVLNGGLGNDILIGGVGKDAFLFNTALNAISNTDVIKDFQSGSDVLKLEYSVYTGLTFDAQSGALSSTSFVQASTAKTSDQHIIYDQANGALYYDQDGSGTVYAQIQFASVTPNIQIVHSDIFVI